METRRGSKGAGFVVGCAFLFLQVVWIFVQLPMESRYFSWAMFHSVVEYRATAEVNGRTLTADEFAQRYRTFTSGKEHRALQHLKDKIVVTEARYGGSDRVSVRIDYVESQVPGSWTWTSGEASGGKRP